jgi:hypothetical protein
MDFTIALGLFAILFVLIAGFASMANLIRQLIQVVDKKKSVVIIQQDSNQYQRRF